MACVMGVLQACSGADATSPISHNDRGSAAPLGARIIRVQSDTVAPGSSLVITGEQLRPGSSVSVSVAGISLPARVVSSTRIEATVAEGALPCTSTGPQSLMVSTADAEFSASVIVRSATVIALAPGESVNMTESRCAELVQPTGSANARYIVAVVNTSESPDVVTGFELRGSGTRELAGVTATPRVGAGFMQSSPGSSGSVLSASAAPWTPTRIFTNGSVATVDASAYETAASIQAHDDHLAVERSITNRVGSPLPVWRALQATRAESGVPAARSALRVNDVLSMTAMYNSCHAGQAITARVVYAGSKAVVLEDVRSPRAGTMDAQYQLIGDEFDRVQYPLLRDQIGDPLAMNAQMGGDGRVTMLFTPYVNDSVPGATAFVSACNFYPRGTFAASNQNEVLYGRVADMLESPAEWRRSLRSTVMHEAKHLASFAERFAQGHGFEEPWLEESTARIAEELYSRTFDNGGTWKGNSGFAGTIQCELQQCDDRPLMMWKHFSVLHAYMQDVETLSPLGSTAGGDFTWYSSGWSLVRWAADQYAGNEGAWLKALVRGGSSSGITHLAEQTGRPGAELLADWSMANAVDDLPGFTPARAQLTFPSWNVNDVWQGLAGSYPGAFVSAPLRGRTLGFGTFAVTVPALRAFSSSYFSFEGEQRGAQLLELRAPDAEATVAFTVVRVQ